jgi:hypothetical protein
MRRLSEGIEFDFPVLKIDMSDLVLSFRNVLVVLATADRKGLEHRQQVLWNWLIGLEIFTGLSKGLDEFRISINSLVCGCGILSARTKDTSLRRLGESFGGDA